MHCKFFFSTEVLHYPERNAFGYRIYARTVGEPFLLMASPGKYALADDALLAAGAEIAHIKGRLFERYLRLNEARTADGAA